MENEMKEPNSSHSLSYESEYFTVFQALIRLLQAHREQANKQNKHF